jgi:hypothetical protein
VGVGVAYWLIDNSLLSKVTSQIAADSSLYVEKYVGVMILHDSADGSQSALVAVEPTGR